eukprot:scaffold78040_cov49-Cyclotella_meneghiniana.AAC.4
MEHIMIRFETTSTLFFLAKNVMAKHTAYRILVHQSAIFLANVLTWAFVGRARVDAAKHRGVGGYNGT